MTLQKKVGSDETKISNDERTASNKKFSLARDERWPLIKLENDYAIILDSFERWVADINESMELIRSGRDMWNLQDGLASVVEEIGELTEQMSESLRWCNVEWYKELKEDASRSAKITSGKKEQLSALK